MKNGIIALIIIVLVAAGGAYLAIAHHKKSTPPSTSSSNANTMSTPPSSSASTPSTSTQAPSTNSVTINNFAFSPASITIKKGTTVTWTNKDSVTHTVTENDGQTGPASGNVVQNASYSFMFNTVGTFKYHCSIHPDMTGTVIVTD